MHFASQRRIKAIKMSKTLILIPSRMSASRLPGKPLLKIDGMSIISRVYSIANESNIGETFVATEDTEIYDEIKKAKRIIAGPLIVCDTVISFKLIPLKSFSISGKEYTLTPHFPISPLDKI